MSQKHKFTKEFWVKKDVELEIDLPFYGTYESNDRLTVYVMIDEQLIETRIAENVYTIYGRGRYYIDSREYHNFDNYDYSFYTEGTISKSEWEEAIKGLLGELGIKK
jgi:hypothetical protein